MEEIADNIFVETGKLGSNNTMIVTTAGIVLVDSPHKPTDAVAWRREVESRGQVAYLINTDHHIDHTMGNAFLPGTIVAHEGTRRQLAGNAPTLEFMIELLGTIDPGGIALMEGYATRLPAITVNDRMTLHCGDVTLELSHHRGHTPNNLMVHVPERNILISGDLVCEAGLPAFVDACLFDWFEAVKRIMEMGVRHVVPGHGEVCTPAEVGVFYDRMEELVGKVKREIEAGRPMDEIAASVRFADNIHTTTPAYRGYPEELIEEFQRLSIAAIYDQLVVAGA
jgi:cyclase